MVAHNNENVEVSTLQQTARELFCLPGVILQIWDKGFEDWVDLEDGDPTPTNSRVKVELDKDARSTGTKHVIAISNHQDGPSGPEVVLSEKQIKPPNLHISQCTSHSQAGVTQQLSPSSAGGSPGSSQTHLLMGCSSSMNKFSLNSVTSTTQQRQSGRAPSQSAPSVQESMPVQTTKCPSHSAHKNITTSSHSRRNVLQYGTNYADSKKAEVQARQISTMGHVGKATKGNYCDPNSFLKITKTVSLATDHEDELINKVHVVDDEELPTDEVPSISEAADVTRLTSKVVKRGNSKWIYLYKFPDFPVGLSTKLRCGLTLRNSERSLLLDFIYNTVTLHTFYPSTSDYNYLTDKLLETFPQLYNQAGPFTDRGCQRDVWKQRLMHKFKNKRKRIDRNIPVVQLHKRTACKANYETLDQFDTCFSQYQVMDVEERRKAKGEEYEEVKDEVVIKEEQSDFINIYDVMAVDTV